MCIDVSLKTMNMDEMIGILVIYIVLRACLAFIKAWWHGDNKNDFRRDR